MIEGSPFRARGKRSVSEKTMRLLDGSCFAFHVAG
jgi:hypothetical protein